EWVQIGWDDAFALWAKVIREADPAQVGTIGGGRFTNEEAYLAQYVFRKAGVRNIDWRVGRQIQASPGRNGGKLDDLANVDAIFIVGESPVERAPIMDLRIRRAARLGRAKLVRIGSFERPYPDAIPFVDVATVADAVRQAPGAKRVAVVWDGVDSAQVKELLGALPPSATVLAYISGEQGNARGAEAMGMHPALGPGYAQTEAGLDTTAMLEAARDGKMRVLSILGANPVLNYYDGAMAAEALEQTPFVVVSDLFMTETAQKATLLLPAKGAFEKDGTTTNLAGDVLPLNAAVDLATPGHPLTDLEMLVGLAQELGIALPTAEELDETVIGHLASAAENFTLGDPMFGATHSIAAQPGDGARVIFETRIFAGGGTVAHDDAIEALRPLPQVAMSPAHASRTGVTMGDYVDLQTSDRNCTMHDVLVEVRQNVPDDAVVLIDGLPDDMSNCFAPGTRVTVVNVRKQTAQLVGAPA
ncbi:MAG: molybdopterin-dependent oxidoreductase, partial [Candidatus Eremiobacteraeota bacterium]|nr:molybdopterin-dependent oxidoreductase [Candidatus Eremiobacteraeota bacterium]